MSVYNRSGTLIADKTPTTTTAKPLNGLKLSLLGDSISSYRGYVPEGNHYYYNGSKAGVSSVDQMWWKVLCTETGMEPLVIDAWSGTGVTALDGESRADRTPMSDNSRCSRLHSGSTLPNVILIAGGVNDYTYATGNKNEPLAWNGHTNPVAGNSFTEAYAVMIKQLHTNYPKAIVVALSTWFTMRGTDTGDMFVHSVSATNHTYSQADYNIAIESVANHLHVPYVRVDDIGINRSNMYPTYAEDSDTHPAHVNSKGQALMGKYLASVLPIIAGSFAASL